MLRRILTTNRPAMLVLPFVSICSEKSEHLRFGVQASCFRLYVSPQLACARGPAPARALKTDASAIHLPDAMPILPRLFAARCWLQSARR